MVAPIECGTNAVVGIPARQVPTICHDIGQALDDIGHARGKCKATEKDSASKGEINKSTGI